MTSSVFLWRAAAVLWAAKIFWLSTETFSGTVSRPLLLRLLHVLHVQLSPDAFWVLHLFVRKSAHLFEYAVFAFLLYRCFSVSGSLIWRPRLALGCIAAAAAYSLTDEFHQLFARGRGASLLDCVLDTAGAILGMLCLYRVAAPSGTGQKPGLHLDPGAPPPSPVTVAQNAE